MTSSSVYVQRDRLIGGITGLLIGDAVSLPFHAAEKISAAPDQAMWSDEVNQALQLLISLLTQKRLDLDDLAQRLVHWGRPTDASLDGLRQGLPPDKTGGQRAWENGHGSLMRVLSLALWHQGPDSELMALAARQSLPTHGHPCAQVACALYCLWARAEIQHRSDGAAWAAQVLRSQGEASGLSGEAIKQVMDSGNLSQPRDPDHLMAALWAARIALDETTDYAGAVRRAVASGRATTTAAAITGGLAGLRHGLYGIPIGWRQGLRGQSVLQPILQMFLHRNGQEGPMVTSPRTSRSHPLQIGTVPLARGGRVGITFCPGKNQAFGMTGSWERDLDTDLEAIRAWGATHLVTLVIPEELVELGVSDLPERAQAHGLIWRHAPILDGHVPGILPPGVDGARWFEGVWPALHAELDAALNRGEGVVVHCKGGLGRAGTVAALLVAGQSPGQSAAEVIDRVRSARPNAVETVVQERYLVERIDGDLNPSEPRAQGA